MIVAGVVVVAVLAAGAVLALSGGDGGTSKPKLKASTSVDLTVGETKVESLATPVPLPTEFPADVRDKVLSAIGTYVDEGMVAPLRKGTVDDAKLDVAFDTAAVARLTGTDRAVLVDEGLPKATGAVVVKTPPVPLTALSEVDGKIVLVSAAVDLDIRSRSEQGITTISRAGTIVFALQFTGDWKITAWTLHVDRNGAGFAPAPTSTTGASG
jgi:hypothetical protein